MRRGDVVDVELDAGRRPGVIVTRDSLIEHLANVTIVEITSTYRDSPTTVALDRPHHGLDRPSIANALNLQTVRKSRVSSVRGALEPRELARLERALLIALDLDT